MKSLLSQNQIECPAPANVRRRPAEVGQDVRVVAARVLERVREDGEVAERAVGVDRLGHSDGGGRSPDRIERDWAEGVAEDVTNVLNKKL